MKLMDQIMNKLQSSLILSLPLLSFNTNASRPAEDDPVQDYTSLESQTSSNIPAPDTEYLETIPEAPSVEETSAEPVQTGDVLEVNTEARPQVILLDFPRRGMNMSKVINELGEPSNRHPAIGKPPITRWDYPDRAVFFEYSHVIHVVAR